VASGYDVSSNVPYRLMKGRLGVYDKQPYYPGKEHSNPEKDGYVLTELDPAIDGVPDQAARFR
jgi:hypothetical protein